MSTLPSLLLRFALLVVVLAFASSEAARLRNNADVDWNNRDVNDIGRAAFDLASGKFLALRGKKSVDHLLRGRRGGSQMDHLLRGRRGDDFHRILRGGDFNHLLRGKRSNEIQVTPVLDENDDDTEYINYW